MSSTTEQPLPDPVASAMATREKEQTKFKERCDGYIASGLGRNMTVRFLLDNLQKLGCQPPKGFIKCLDCGDTMAGGGFGVVEQMVVRKGNASVDSTSERSCRRDIFDAQNSAKETLKLIPEIYLCQQHLRDETHAHESMVHELIHAIDVCRTKMDPFNNCMHLACTEIRAENLSGECGTIREMMQGRITSFPGHGQECVKRRAALSLQANPKCREKSDEYIDAAMERCFADTFPFDRHPNLR